MDTRQGLQFTEKELIALRTSFKEQLQGYLADSTELVWKMQHLTTEQKEKEHITEMCQNANELCGKVSVLVGLLSRWMIIETEVKIIVKSNLQGLGGPPTRII